MTCLLWPSDTGIVYGLVEGKVCQQEESVRRPGLNVASTSSSTSTFSFSLSVPQVRLANTHTNKSSSIYTTESCVISLASK